MALAYTKRLHDWHDKAGVIDVLHNDAQLSRVVALTARTRDRRKTIL